MKAAVSGEQFDFSVTFESGARNHIEDAVSPVPVICRIAAALNFDDVHVLGIELWANVGGDVGVGDGNTVNEPGDLVAAAHVKLIVDHVCTGGVIGDQIEAVGARGARSRGYGFAAQHDWARRGSSVDGLRSFPDFHSFGDAGDLEREMAQ